MPGVIYLADAVGTQTEALVTVVQDLLSILIYLGVAMLIVP